MRNHYGQFVVPNLMTLKKHIIIRLFLRFLIFTILLYLCQKILLNNKCYRYPN